MASVLHATTTTVDPFLDIINLKKSKDFYSASKKYINYFTQYNLVGYLPFHYRYEILQLLQIPLYQHINILDYLTEQLQPSSADLQCDIYQFLIEKLTPKHFLSDKDFTDQRKYFYLDAGNNSTDYFEDPKNLSKLGKLVVYTELKRLENTYLEKYAELPDTKEKLLDHDAFLAIYLYTTNLGYKKINSQLRFGHDHKCERLIDLIQRGIDRLSSFPEFQLDTTQHQLIRYMNLPDDVLKKIVLDALAMNHFLDEAFLSTSFNKQGASEFINDSNIELIVKTNGCCSGAKINGISPFPQEGEYLFTPGTKFQCHTTKDASIIKIDDDNCPIKYDEKRKIWSIYVCAVNFKTVVETAMLVQRALTRFKAPIRERARLLPTQQDTRAATLPDRRASLPVTTALPSLAGSHFHVTQQRSQSFSGLDSKVNPTSAAAAPPDKDESLPKIFRRFV